MKGWKSCLLWEGIPFLLLLFIFGSLSAINWDYERKLVSLDNTALNWTDAHLGPILLAVAIGHALIASCLLLLVRFTRPKSNMGLYMLASLTLITIFLILPSVAIIVLGPAGITMIEQTRNAPR